MGTRTNAWTGALLCLLVASCGDDDSLGMEASKATGADPGASAGNSAAAMGDRPSVGIGDSNTGASGMSGRAGAGAGASGASGASGDGQGGRGNAGVGDEAGAGGDDGIAGVDGQAGSSGVGGMTGSSGGTNGDGLCDLVCPLGTRCALEDITCIQAPCNPVPTCVADDSAGGRGGGGAVGAVCGTRGAARCPAGQFCNHPIGADCGRADAPGECEPMPAACTREFRPVCGCDGTTYSNPCTAASAGVSVERDGEC